MQRTKSKILSILLSLVMLLSLLPTTALAAGSASSVELYYGNGSTTSLSNGECLATNTDTSETSYTSGDPYVARYDSGTLYLDGYDVTDVKIFADGDLNIEVVSKSSFTTSKTSADDLYGIQANGKLNISGSGKLTVTAKGDGNVYGIYANEGVTISAPLEVKVGKVDSSKNGPLYGIYTKSGAISLSGNDMTVTATIAKENVYGVYNAADASTASTDNGNITISGKLTVSLSNGSYNRGISSQGGVITLDGAIVKIPGSYYYGIFNKNGNVDIKNNSDVDISSDISGNIGIHNTDGNLNIEDSTVKVSAKGYAADPEKGKLSIKDSIVDLTRDYSHNCVVNTANDAANTIDLSGSGSGSVTLTASGDQSGNSMIGGTVSITTPGTKLEKGKHYPNLGTYDGLYDDALKKTVLKFVHNAAASTPTASVSDVTIDGVKGSLITNKDVVITLTNDTFESTPSGDWITNLPTGLSQSLSRTDDTHAKITVSGTPTATSSDALVIKIPAANLVSNADLTVTSNANAKYNITAPATPITETLVPVSDLTGKTYNESAQEPTFGGSLIRDTDYTVSYAVKSSFTGTLNSDGKPVGAGTYVVTVAGIGSYTGSFTKDFKIDKADPVYSQPTAKTGLAYTGSALDLINAGTVTKGGEMQYKQGSGSYGAGIPVATNAGDYTVYYQITANDNYNAVAETQVGTGAINIAQVEWGTPTETLTPVNPTTVSGSDGQITGTTSAMQYKKSTESGWTDCPGNVTGLYAGTYYVRYKADSNHTASDTNYKTVTLTDPGATLYGVTVTDGTAAPTGDQAAGAEVTITANTKTGFNFKEWTGLADSNYKTGFTKTSNPATFIMPASAVNVTATYDPAALSGTASITGTLKFNEELTATLNGGNNTGNLDYKWYQNGTTQVAANNTGKYTLRADDIGKTITVKITSDVQTGEITSAATAAVDRADGPAAPTAFTLSFTLNSDGTTFTATIPAFAGGEYSFDGTTYSTTNTKTDCAANTIYTGYARVKETATHKTGTEISDTQTSPKLTVATPTFTPNGASGFTGTQSVTISCTTAGAKIYYTTDGTTPTASSTEYTTALSLTSTTTVKAIAVNAGMNDSAIATATFTKYSGGGGGGGGSYTPSYTVSVDKTENGIITVSPKSASKGDAVTITVKPDKGYELDTLKVLDKNGDKVKLTEKNGKYTFTMPTGKVTVKGSFVEETPVQIFKDVPVDAYYYEAVKWAAEKGITGGIGNGLFGPNQPCTRAQIVTFLWRAAGSPAPKHMSSFADVPADAFYAKAVAWAVENGITGGTGDGKFSPDATCTRAQSVTFLYRAAGSPKVSGSAEFGDVATNAYYADAVAWAAKNGITGGIGGGLFGSGNDCTRAQIVTFLYRNYQSK